MRSLLRPGAGLLAGNVTDGSFRIQARGQNVYPMTLLRNVFTVHGGAPQLGGEIDPSVPSKVACLVGCGVCTGYGSVPHGRRPAGRRRGHRRQGGVGMAALRARSARAPAATLRGAGGMET